jgi:hypothetical protein
MSVRPEVQRFVDSGPLPSESASIEEIQKREKELLAIDLPATTEEARLLITCFGPDQLYGMNQTLRSLIESAPESVLTEPPPEGANRWVKDMWARMENARLRDQEES